MAFTAHDAALALRDVPNIEERLTGRILGITLMLWGIAAAAIFLAYGAYAGPVWGEYVLWLPIVLVGMVATHYLWQAHHQALDIDDHGHATWLPFVAIGLPAAATYILTDVVLGWSWGVGVAMLVGNAGALVTVSHWFKPLRPHARAGAFLMFVVAYGVGWQGPAGEDLLLAAGALLGWGLPGKAMARRG